MTMGSSGSEVGAAVRPKPWASIAPSWESAPPAVKALLSPVREPRELRRGRLRRARLAALELAALRKPELHG